MFGRESAGARLERLKNTPDPDLEQNQDSSDVSVDPAVSQQEHGAEVAGEEKREGEQPDLDIEIPDQFDSRTDDEKKFESDANCFLQAIAKEIMSRDFDPAKITLDPETQKQFIDIIAFQNQGKEGLAANLQEVGKLIPKLPKICEQFRTEIFKLKDTGIPELGPEPGLDKSLFNAVEDKGREIMMDLLTSVAEGYLTAEDFSRLVTTVQIKDRASLGRPNKEIMFCDPNTGQIIILKEALVDQYQEDDKTIPLDFKHMINHEVSHRIVETSLKHNEKIVKLAQGLANSDLAPLLPMRLQRALVTYKDQPDVLCTEIMADYSSLFICTDGSFRSFFDNCVNKAVLAGKSEFVAALGIDGAAWDVAVAQGSDAKMALLQSNPKFSALVGTYKEMHKEIAATLKAEKGTLGTREEGEEESEIYYEGYQGFQQATPSSPRQNQGRGHNEGSIWGAIGEMAKAFYADVNPTKQSA